MTFEIKPKGKIGVEAIFESLAHRQRVNRSYAIFHSTEEEFENSNESNRIKSLAVEHGVGVYLAGDPADFGTWTEHVPATRWNPEYADLNEFIQDVMPSCDHDAISNMFGNKARDDEQL